MSTWNWRKCIFRKADKCLMDLLSEDICHYLEFYGAEGTCECGLHKLARLEVGPIPKFKRVLTSTGSYVNA